MLGIGMFLLGGAKSIMRFVAENWKWVLPVALLIGGYFYYQHQIKAAYDSGYVEATAHEQELQRERIAVENKKNREFEAALEKAIDSFGRELIEDTANRVAKESGFKETIRTMIRDNPVYSQCKVDPEVITARNGIRALGPSIRLELPDNETN